MTASQSTPDPVERVVQSAARRMIVAAWGRRFSRTVGWTLGAAGLAIAGWPWWSAKLGLVDAQLLPAAATAAALAVLLAAVIAAIWTLLTKPSPVQTAAEVDRRFGLRERLASTLAVRGEGPATAALRGDASRAAGQIKVADRFPVRPLPRLASPLLLVPAILLLALGLEAFRPAADPTASATVDADEIRQVRAATSAVKQQLAAKRREAEAKGLKDASELLAQMERQVDKLSKRTDLDRKEAMIELNHLRDQIEKRRDMLGDPDTMKRTMAQIKPIGDGPIAKTAEAIRKGDFAAAEKQIRELSKAIRDGKMTEAEKEKLAKQAKQIAKQVAAAAQDQRRRKEQLQQQIDEAEKAGKTAEAAELKRKLREAQAADESIAQAQQMAAAMQAAADAMQAGDGKAAAEAMEGLADQMSDMQSQTQSLQDMDSAMNSLAQGNQQMGCQQCQGDGCEGCQGGGGWGEKFQQGDFGQGRGPGAGMRDEADGDTNTYETQVAGKVQKGQSVISGYADGPNRKGVTREAIAAAIESSIGQDADPMEDQVLPRDQREQTRQYFESLRQP